MHLLVVGFVVLLSLLHYYGAVIIAMLLCMLCVGFLYMLLLSLCELVSSSLVISRISCHSVIDVVSLRLAVIGSSHVAPYVP